MADTAQIWIDRCFEMKDENADLRARIEALEAALKPFADAAMFIPSCSKDWREDWYNIYELAHEKAINVGDLRAARAAMEKKNEI